MSGSRTPFCAFCLKSGVLCKKCGDRLATGENSKLDLEISKFLLDEAKGLPHQEEIAFHRAQMEGDYLALVVGKGQSHILQDQKIVKDLSKKYGKRVKLLEEAQSTREFLESLFSPLRIVTLNTIWLPDGSKQTRVIVSRAGPRINPGEREALKALAKRLRNLDIRVELP